MTFIQTVSERTAMGLEPVVKGKLLIVDDERPIRWALRKTLRAMGFETVEVDSGDEAIALVSTVGFDAVLLDIGMPGRNGIETCTELRKLMPLAGILMLTVNNSETDKVSALDAGADDYITKPFHLRELAARLRAAVRRARSFQDDDNASIRIGEIELDPIRREVKRLGLPIRLTPKEFELLHFLMRQAGLPLTHSRILGSVWGPEYRSKLEYLRTFIRQLRKKLGDDAALPKYLMTDAQIGYRFNENPSYLSAGE